MGIREDSKEVEIKDRRFVIRKFDALSGSYILFKVMGILAPLLKGLDVTKFKVQEGQVPDLNVVDIVSVMSGLSSLSEQDFFYVSNKCLQVCFEPLPAGQIRVMNHDGSFGVIGLDTDSATILALVAHALIFNLTGFFGGSPLALMFGGLLNLSSPGAKM